MLARALPHKCPSFKLERIFVVVSQAGYKTDSDSAPSPLRRKHGPGGADGGDENQPQEGFGGGAANRLPQLHSRYGPSTESSALYFSIL